MLRKVNAEHRQALSQPSLYNLSPKTNYEGEQKMSKYYHSDYALNKKVKPSFIVWLMVLS